MRRVLECVGSALPVVVVFFVACGTTAHLTPEGELSISGSAFPRGGSGPANLAFVGIDRGKDPIAVSADADAAGGGWFVELAVRNFGGERANAPLEVAVYVDGALERSRILSGPLGVDQTARGRIPIGSPKPGVHEIRLVIDPANRIAESMKSDNELRTTFTVPSAR